MRFITVNIDRMVNLFQALQKRVAVTDLVAEISTERTRDDDAVDNLLLSEIHKPPSVALETRYVAS